MRYWSLGIAFFFLPFWLSAQMQLRVPAEKDSVYLGDQIPILISLDLPAQAASVLLDFSAWEDYPISPANPLDSTAAPERVPVELLGVGGEKLEADLYVIALSDYPSKVKQQEQDPSRKSLQVDLIFWKGGTYQLPYPDLIYTHNGKEERLRAGKFLRFTIFSPIPVDVPPDSLEQIAPIKPIYREPLALSDVLPVLLTGLGVLALGVLAFVFWKRYKNRAEEVVYQPPVPPIERAMQRMKDLEEKQWWQKGKFKVYYSQLTFILREYLEHKLGVPALENTSRELLNGLPDEIPDTMVASWKSLFQTSDMVKFAKSTPDANLAQKHFAQINEQLHDLEALFAPPEPEQPDAAE